MTDPGHDSSAPAHRPERSAPESRITVRPFGPAPVGLWHGVMVTRLNVPPFVITLVTYTVAQGTALAITSGSPINNLDPVFSNLSQYYIGEVPVPALFFVGAAAVAWFVLERTYVGRQIYAVGGNKEAARLAGIPTARRITST
ncbi:ABC transporter permease [Streptomyces sp. NPDC127079]|uniref:ABC transporter permease n=1 Tax=Streptomyces sp. NPDC127079 TaxID=3347132 RepID=UPI00365E6244